MALRLPLGAAAAAALIASTAYASAQGTINGSAAGSPNVTAAPVAPQPSTGIGTTGAATVSRPAAPSTVAPARIGAGATPSGLPGDNPQAPGFPGKVGK